jgi:hypothetical protein
MPRLYEKCHPRGGPPRNSLGWSRSRIQGGAAPALLEERPGEGWWHLAQQTGWPGLCSLGCEDWTMTECATALQVQAERAGALGLEAESWSQAGDFLSLACVSISLSIEWPK